MVPNQILKYHTLGKQLYKYYVLYFYQSNLPI